MKQTIITTLLVAAVVGAAVWILRGELVKKKKEQEFAQRLADATRTLDSALQVTYRARPAEKESVQHPVRPVRPDHRRAADSAFNAGYAAGEAAGAGRGLDSVRALFAQLAAPRDTVVAFAGGDTLIHQSDPLRRMDIYTLIPAPRRDSTWTVTKTIYVPTPVQDSWYEHWETQVLTGALLLIALVK